MTATTQRLALGAVLGFVLALMVLIGCLSISAGGGTGVDRPFVASFPYAALWAIHHERIDAMVGLASQAQGMIYGIALAGASIKKRAWFLIAVLAVGHVAAAAISLRLCALVWASC